MSHDQSEALTWYLTRANNGRGRITGSTRKLLSAGLLTLRWTSAVTWVLTLSAKGRQLLADQPCNCTICGERREAQPRNGAER